MASSLINFLEKDRRKTVLYYFCSSFNPKGNDISHILRCLTAQLLRQHRILAAHIHKEYIEKGQTPSVSRLKGLLCDLQRGTSELYICVDGIDECADKDQAQIILGLTPLVQPQDTGSNCKILFASRDIRAISKHLKKYTTVALTQERRFIESAIQSYVHDSLLRLRDQGQFKEQQKDLIDRVEHDLVVKAEGL